MGSFTEYCETNLRKNVCQASFVSARQPIICVVRTVLLCGENLKYSTGFLRGMALQRHIYVCFLEGAMKFTIRFLYQLFSH